MIYAIGDSHSSVFSGSVCANYIQPQYNFDYVLKDGNFIKLHEGIQSEFIKNAPNFTALRTGTNTAYGMLDKIELVDDIIREYKISKTDDYILFCYGEIDTRVHIGKQEELQDVHVEKVIKDLTERYFQFVCKYVNDGYRVIVWGVPPSGKNAREAHPKYFTYKERNVLSKRINEYFEEACKKYKIGFEGSWEDIVESDNYFSYFLDDIHLSYSACKELIDCKFKKYF